MGKYEENNFNCRQELDDDQLDQVVGGVSAGDVVTCRCNGIKYCPGCGKLLNEFTATITGLRGVLNGVNMYYCTYNCCGQRSSIVETSIVK